MKKPIRTLSLSSPLRRLLADHQTLCHADCCKAAAFRFRPDSIARWLDLERVDRTRAIAEEIASVGVCVREAEGRITLAARGAESEWDANEFRLFWEHFEEVFSQAVKTREVGRVP